MALECRRLLEVGQPEAAAAQPQASTSSQVVAVKRKQPNIVDAIHQQAEDAYRKLLMSAYLLAIDGQPLTTFKTIVRVQKANGVKLIQGTDSSNRAREFITQIADTIRSKISMHLQSDCAFSILSDGSQARKTGSEKELVLVRIVKDGVPTYFVVALVDMDVYGDATAQNLKRAIDDVFRVKVPIEADRYTKLQVSATADGASVNTGIYNGLLTKMKADSRPWLLPIHCVSHRLELAIKESLLKHPQFDQVKDVMITIFYMFKQSGKLKRQFFATAEALGVHVYTFPKVHGTRFVNHQRNGVRVLLHNWLPLIDTIENAVATAGGRAGAASAKQRGILERLRDARFLGTASLFKAILDIVARLSLTFEAGEIAVFDIMPAISRMQADLDDLVADDTSPIAVNGKTLTGNELSYSLPKPGHMKRHEENREYVIVTYKRMKNSEAATKDTVGLKTKAITLLKECVDARFDTLGLQNNDIFKHMHWLNPAHWRRRDEESELASMKALATHFAATLEMSSFDGGKVKREWRNLKITVEAYYKGVKANELWERILIYRRAEYSNVCMLVEIILTIGLSNSTVEAGFSFLTAMMTDRRLSMNHDTMESLLVIKANDRIWSAKERDEIMADALKSYMSTRRKLKMETAIGSALGMLGGGKRRRREQAASEDGDGSESDSDSDSDTDNPIPDNSDETSDDDPDTRHPLIQEDSDESP